MTVTVTSLPTAAAPRYLVADGYTRCDTCTANCEYEPAAVIAATSSFIRALASR